MARSRISKKQTLGNVVNGLIIGGMSLVPSAVAGGDVHYNAEHDAWRAPLEQDLMHVGEFYTYDHTPRDGATHPDMMVESEYRGNLEVDILGADVNERLSIPVDSGIRVVSPDGNYNFRSNVSRGDRASYALVMPMDVESIVVHQGEDVGPTISPYQNVLSKDGGDALGATAIIRDADGNAMGWLAYVSVNVGAPTQNSIDVNYRQQ